MSISRNLRKNGSGDERLVQQRIQPVEHLVSADGFVYILSETCQLYVATRFRILPMSLISSVEDAPKMTGIVEPELPKGYQFDYINAEVIECDLFVKDGLLTLPHGTQYRILVLPKLETMRPELLAKIGKLIEDGAVVLGPAPKRSPSGESFPTG